MKRLASAKGEVRLGSILTLAVVAFTVYVGVKFAPVLFAQYEFGDAVVDEAKFSRAKSAETVRNNLADKAASLGLPITRQQIHVERKPTWTRIQVDYELSVEWLPGKVYTWDVTEVSESVLF